MNKVYDFKTHRGKVLLRTSSVEIKHLLIAWLLVSLAFGIMRTVGSGIEPKDFFGMSLLISMLVSALTVGIAFVLHELAHKIVAQRYHCWAEFRADMRMLGLGILMSFLGFVFIAPGAVIIYGHITDRQNGKISLAGPLTNIILAIIMLPLLFITITNPLLRQIINSGYAINAWLALFNMIPVWNFDGAKIWRWNKTIYFSTVIVAFFLSMLYYII